MSIKNRTKKLSIKEAALYLRVKEDTLGIFLQKHRDIMLNDMIDTDRLELEIEKESLKIK